MVKPQVNSERMHTQESRGNQQPYTCRKDEFKLEIKLENVTFPEFFETRKVGKMTARLFAAECQYDAIIGRDILNELGLILDFKTQKISWDYCHVPMRPFPSTETKKTVPGQRPEPTPAERLHLDILEAELEDNNTLTTYDLTETNENDFPNDEFYEDSEQRNDHNEMYQAEKKQINVSKYETADNDEIVRGCSHLNQVQQNGLRNVLSKYPKLFDNELGTYPDERIHLDLKDGVVPHCQPRAYTVPINHREVFKAEFNRLVKIRILEEASRSEWIARTFIIPKKLLPGKDVARVRWISNFRGLNLCLKRKTYPIPKIGDILARRTGYQFLTKMDISMQYYTFELDNE